MPVVQDEPMEVVARVGAALLQDDVVATLSDPAAAERFSELLAESSVPELETVMVAPDYLGPRGRLEYSGPEGFQQAWREWVEAYESYTIEIEEITEGTEGRVLILALQHGRTKTGGVEISEPAAAVWTVRDGKLVRLEFHLDRDVGRRAAGLGV